MSLSRQNIINLVDHQGFRYNLVAEMRLTDTATFIHFHRMTPVIFYELLSMVGPLIQQINIGGRPITAAQLLSLTIRYLASGDSLVTSGTYGYCIGKIAAALIIKEACEKLWQVLMPTAFPELTVSMWKGISRQFQLLWNFPHCVGSMDGKHVIIKGFEAPGSILGYFRHSLVIYALCDAEYKFIAVDIGISGFIGDSNLFKVSKIGKALIGGASGLRLPPPEKLADNKSYPFVFIGDEAFPLLPNLMRPYPNRKTTKMPLDKRAFNYRLSRVRKVVENTFGVLANRWRIYREPIVENRPTVLAIVKATVTLHNWLRQKKSIEYMSADMVDRYGLKICRPGRWRNDETTGMECLQRAGINTPSKNAVDIREAFTKYFTTFDILPRQYSTVL